MKRLLRIFGFASIIALIAATSWWGGASGCNTSELAGHGSDDGSVVGSEQDAKDTAMAGENIAFRSFTAAFGSPAAALVSEDEVGLILEKMKSTVTASSRSSCAKGSVPSPSGSSVTINGSVSGACAVKYEGDASNGTVRANCTNYNDGTDSGEASVDDLVGAVGTSSDVGGQSSFTFSPVTSDLLILTLANGSNCSAVLNMTTDVTIDDATGSGSFDISGCVSICGESFDVSGSDTF